MAKCSVCGKEVEKMAYYGNICSEKCFHDWYWKETLDDKAIIVNGECYHDGGYKENPRRYSFLGHGGRVFHYRMKGSDNLITTNNLWCNGTVPNEIEVEDNAEFVEEKYESK